jgi:hypothetical protein
MDGFVQKASNKKGGLRVLKGRAPNPMARQAKICAKPRPILLKIKIIGYSCP